MIYMVAWVVILIACAVLEGMTASLVSIWFCVGAVAALVAAALDLSVAIQIAIFVVFSLVSMIIIRPLTKRYFVKTSEKTNADRIIGAEGIVTETVNNLLGTGQIRVKSEYWTARTEQDIEIPEGALVRVLRIEGVKAIVTKS